MNEGKKKILYLITKSNWGGAQRYVYDLSVNIPKDKFEVAVAFGEEGRLKDMLGSAGIRTISIKRLGRDIKIIDDLLVFFDILGLLFKERPDILHLNSTKIGVIGALAGRVARTPNIIFTIHGWAFRENRPFGQKIIIRFLSWITVLMSHHSIAVSEKDLEDSPKFLVAGKVSAIHNGIGKINFEKRNTARELLAGKNKAADKENIYIGTIAELHKNKGLSYAIEAMAQISKDFRGVEFFIISEGEEWKNLEKKIKDLHLSRRVHLVGFIDNAPRLLPAFDIFILPSVKEGLPYTIIEAGQAKLPVIATSVGGIPEIIEDMKTGILIRPKQPGEIYRAISFLINNREKAKEMGKNLSQKIEADFSLEEVVKKTVDLYS